MKQLRKRLTYANVMSTITLFLVLGGGAAVAANQLAKNSVGAKQLKRNAVTAAKIKNNSVTAAKIQNNAVGSAKIQNNAVTAAKIQNGAVGAGKIGLNAVGTGQLAEDAVTIGKLANGAVNSGKITNGAVTSGKIANGAVGANDLTENERSQAFAATASSEINLPEKYGNPSEYASVLSLNVPNGNWLLNAHVTIAVGAAEPIHVVCRLSQGATVIALGGFEAKNVGLVPSVNDIQLSGLATAAGTVTVTCADNGAGGAAINRNLIATRVGSVTG